jgi:hypothetical protein
MKIKDIINEAIGDYSDAMADEHDDNVYAWVKSDYVKSQYTDAFTALEKAGFDQESVIWGKVDELLGNLSAEEVYIDNDNVDDFTKEVSDNFRSAFKRYVRTIEQIADTDHAKDAYNYIMVN